MLVVAIAPWLAHMFLTLLVGRTEAHRDVFDKTTTFVLMPEAMMSNHVNSAMSTQFGALTPQTRRHAFADFPPLVPDSINNILDPPGNQAISIGPFSLDLFAEGFPNATVEGWEYITHPKAFTGQGLMHFMTYGAVIRSPWTRLGWPWVATQDIIAEPGKMQGWQGDQEQIDDPMRERYKLAE